MSDPAVHCSPPAHGSLHPHSHGDPTGPGGTLCLSASGIPRSPTCPVLTSSPARGHSSSQTPSPQLLRRSSSPLLTPATSNLSTCLFRTLCPCQRMLQDQRRLPLLSASPGYTGYPSTCRAGTPRKHTQVRPEPSELPGHHHRAPQPHFRRGRRGSRITKQGRMFCAVFFLLSRILKYTWRWQWQWPGRGAAALRESRGLVCTLTLLSHKPFLFRRRHQNANSSRDT